jgi:flagellar capping protein FliD
MKKSEELKRNAENCADLAASTQDKRSKRRYERMEEAWSSLAKTQAWLDGEKGDAHAEK